MASPRVLIVRLSSLGDVVLATSAVERFAVAKPGERVDILTKPAFEEIFRDNPAVGEVLLWGADDSPLAVAKRLRKRGYDHIIDLHDNLRTRALRFLVRGVKWSVYKKGSIRRRYAVARRSPGSLDGKHVVERYTDALAPLGIHGVITLPKLYPSKADEAWAAEILKGKDSSPLHPVAFAPGAKWATKGWPKGKWADLLGVTLKDEGVFPVMIGGVDERGLCADILAEGGIAGVNAAGEGSILQSAALIGACEALVTGDSAPLHIACAVDTPVVAIFGPTVRGFGFYPLGVDDRVVETELDCRPCSLHGDDSCPKGHFKCMESISPERVFDALNDVLALGVQR